MKIHQLLDGPSIIITNEESSFIRRHGNDVSLTFLDQHQKWVAQNLVRKGVYSISNDRTSIIKRTNADER